MDNLSLSYNLQSRYQQQLDVLPFKVRSYAVSTASGRVWINEAGPEQGPVLLCLHGLQTPSPFMLELVAELTAEYRVIVPDLPGQAGKTQSIAPVPINHGYAHWLDELMDALEIPGCAMVGLSFGGAVLLDMASYKPERIHAASLVVPAGFFRPLWRPMKNLIAPFLSFKLHSDLDHFEGLMGPLMGDNWAELKGYYYAVFEAGQPLMIIPPGPFQCEDLCRFHAPVQLFICEDDIYFEPNKQEKLANQALLNLVSIRRLKDLHVPTPANRRVIAHEASYFIRQHA